MREKKWTLRADDLKEKAKKCKVGLDSVVVEYLMSKGYDTPEKIQEFLDYNTTEDFEQDRLRSYKTYKDSDRFLKTLIAALRSNKTITVYGDYDVDGVCSTTIWVRALRRLRNGGVEPNINYFVNHRFNEGYGLNEQGVERLLTMYPDTALILTCDNGVVAMDGVAKAKEKGVRVIISDHHVARPDGVLPDCPVVCEHRLDEDMQLKEDICGAEMSRRLVLGLYDMLGIADKQQNFLRSLLAFSGMATIADSVPLGLANHYIAKWGIKEISKSNYPAFRCLRDIMNIVDLDETTIGFSFAPVINAVSRLTGDVTKDIELFLSDDYDKSLELARELVSINDKRKDLTADNDKMAKKEMEGRSTDPFIILHKQNYNEGICGIVAAHVAETYSKPVIVLTSTNEDSDVYKGSARSLKGFNIKEALDKCEDLLLGYGGHELAAGLSIKKDDIPALREKLSKMVLDSGFLEMPIEVPIDHLLRPSEVTSNLVREFEGLAPFGVGFERPNICLVGNVDEILRMPIKTDPKKHISLTLSDEKAKIKVLWWKSIEKWDSMTKGKDVNKVAVIGKIETTTFKGNLQTQMIVENDKVKIISSEEREVIK